MYYYSIKLAQKVIKITFQFGIWVTVIFIHQIISNPGIKILSLNIPPKIKNKSIHWDTLPTLETTVREFLSPQFWYTHCQDFKTNFDYDFSQLITWPLPVVILYCISTLLNWLDIQTTIYVISMEMILSRGNSKITIAVHFETLLHSDVEKWRMGSI